MVTASAPGKVYVFGEHAVVYGEPAIPCAIDRRATVTVTRRDDERVRVHATDLSLDGFTVEYSGDVDDTPDVAVPKPLVDSAMGYVDGAITQAKEAAEAPNAGFEVTVESELPLGAGLGSSAAVVVATITAATKELGVDLELTEIAERGYRVEYDVQNGQASRADTFCSTRGGAVRVEGSDCRTLEAASLPFVIGYDGGSGETGSLVAKVRRIRDQYGFAADTVAVIGNLVRSGERLLTEDTTDIDGLGRLMNFNHGLLHALGVSSRSLDSMVWAARDAGAAGAKLTGAGGGGCIVALSESDRVIAGLELTSECENVFSAGLDPEGVRVE